MARTPDVALVGAGVDTPVDTPVAAGAVRRLLTTAASDLDVPERRALTILLLPGIVVLAALVSAAAGSTVYKTLIAEDGPIETVQVLLFAASGVIAARVAWRHARAGRAVAAVVIGLLALGLIFATGEEISWGQRMFGWRTPEALAEVNRQGETTLHNIRGIEWGIRWAILAVGVTGTVAPLVLFRRGWRDRFGGLVGHLVPHPVFVPAFLYVAAWRVYRTAFEAPETISFAVSEFSEISELILAVTVALFLVFQLRGRPVTGVAVGHGQNILERRPIPVRSSPR
jgi:hypothetical protein